MTYVYALAVISAIFVVLERLRPRYRDQPILRAGILTDVFYVVFNGHFLGLLLAKASKPAIAWFDGVLTSWNIRESFYYGLASQLPGWLQFIVALLVIDFVHWSIHNMLHRVPALWELHKVHHSIEHMDWLGSMRFHWSEVVIYKTLSYPVLAFLGFDGGVLLALAVVGTAIGHFNHSNMGVKIGPLKYLLNNPEMHIWHHTHPDCGPPMCNFGINLSVWDWIFGTAHVPDAPPAKLAFDDIDEFPHTAAGQLLHPLPVERAVRARLGNPAS